MSKSAVRSCQLLAAAIMMIGAFPHGANSGQLRLVTGPLTNYSLIAENNRHKMPSKSELGKTDDIAFITQLALIEGHVLVGVELYRQGEHNMGVSHVMHPIDEIYEALAPTLQSLGEQGFKPEIDALARAMENNLGTGEVAAIAERLRASIRMLRDAHSDDIGLVHSVAAVMQIAASEYSDGVDNGRVVEDYEYQDAWGFVKTASLMLSNLKDSYRSQHASEIADIEGALTGIDQYWPDVVGRRPLTAPASGLEARANRIVAAAQLLNGN